MPTCVSAYAYLKNVRSANSGARINALVYATQRYARQLNIGGLTPIVLKIADACASPNFVPLITIGMRKVVPVGARRL